MESKNTRLRALMDRIDKLLDESYSLQRTKNSWARHVQIQGEIMQLCRRYADLHAEASDAVEAPEKRASTLSGTRRQKDDGADQKAA